MSNHRKKSAARSDDLISELPDEILLSILWRLSSSREAAMTTVLSKRWRSAWRSYPFVEFDFRDLNGSGEADEISSTAVMAHLRQFADATFDRFSRDKFLLMKTLELVLEKGDSAICSSVVNQLLNLAAERKAVVILIKVISRSHRLSLPLGLLSNSTVKSLRLTGLEKFFLHFYGRVPDEIKIFQIRSAYTAATNEWKADFCMSNDEDPTYPWFVGLKNFVTTFTQFDTVKIHWHRSGKITFEEANNVHPRAIDHLKIDSDLSTSNEQRVLLDGLFWACRPRFLTFIHCDYNGSEKLTEVFSDLTSKYLLQRLSEDGGEGFNGDQSWLHQLKDVKMIMQLKDVTTIMRDTKMVKNYLRQEGEWEYVGDNAVRTCFELTWY
ncbi:Putative FBD-associated F-box protein At5g22720 [Linum perenne]